MKTFLSGCKQLTTCLLLALLCYGLATPAAAQTFNFRTREASVVKTAPQIKAHNGFSDTIVVRQDKWDEMVATGSSWGSNLKFKSVHAFVKFYVNHAYPVKISEPYTFRLAYQVYGYGNMADTNAVTFTKADTLTISYKPDSLAAFQDIQYAKYSNVHKVMIVMNGLYRITGANTPPVAMNLSANGPFYLLNFNVEGSIVVQPFHKKIKVGGIYKDAYGNQAPVLNIGALPPDNDHLPVRWNLDNTSPPAADLPLTPVNYELEWTYVDNYKVDPELPGSTGITTIGTSSLQYNFRDNSTRVWLDTNYYRIPLIYQKGHLIYRVRAVRPDSVYFQYPVYGPWTLTEQGSVSSVPATNRFEITQAHLNDSLNWQYTVSFAEQGKYKHVMSYYDGMLKNRQSITRFNSMPGKLIATEQVYDYEGRPSISLLPTPVNSLSFRYQLNLTLNQATGLPYKAGDFDGIPPGVCNQDQVPSALAATSAAYQYYSPSNPDQAGFQKYVPDAGGYPFVQTVYSPGFDERVEKQGGAGDSLQIGRGHNVKNDYVNSDQTDLNRLFGVDIGWSGYYRKTVSRDPNGQLSLNVTDYKGKTVTSSMVGIPDTTLHALEPNRNVPDTSFYYEDHIAGTAQQISGNKKILDKNFFNDVAGNNQSQYIYTFRPFPTFCNGTFLSVKARYDYSIFDECGKLRVDTGGTLGTTGPVFSGTALSDSSDIVPFFLETGKHSLHKELTINRDDVAAAVEGFIRLSPDKNCLKDEPWFIKQAVLSKEFPCPENYTDMDCGTCEGKKFQMMKELWPNKDSMYVERKYGVYNRDLGTVIGNNNSTMTLLCGKGSNPLEWNMAIDGDSIRLPGGTETPGYYILGPGGFGPGITAGGGFILHGTDTLHCRYRYQDPCLVQLPSSVTRFGRTYTHLQSLPVDTFIMIFNDSIAEALLPLHPEYCSLLACVKDPFHGKMTSIPNAKIAGQLSLFRLHDMILADPIYSKMLLDPARYPHPYDTLAFSLHGRISLDTLALLKAYCQCQDSFMMTDCYNTMFGQQIQNGILNDPYVQEQYFGLVRSLYLTNRERYKSVLSGMGDCSVCSPVRMRLSPPPVFPESVAAGGQPAVGTGILMGMGGTAAGPGFSSNTAEYFHLLQIANADSMASFTDSTHTYTFNQLSDSAITVYNNYNNSLCTGAVDQIMNQLVNCAAPAALNNVRTSLLQLCSSGQVQQGFYSPAQIRWALTSNGIALNDLCNPYLVNYDNNMNFSPQGQSNFRCNNAAFYTDISNTLNQQAVLNALRNPETNTNLNLNTSNGFQLGISQALGGAASCILAASYSAAAHLYTLQFVNGTNRVKLYFRTAESGPCSTAFSPAPGESLSVTVSCINNSPFSQFANGLIGQYTFATTVVRTNGSTVTQCILPAWNDRIKTNSTGENPLAGCVPCNQMYDLYRDFNDTLQAYQVKGADHPYYGTVLRNFMNYKLKKAYAEDQYLDFIQSCALADSMRIPVYGGFYGYLNFNSVAYADAFLTAVNNLNPVTISPGYQVKHVAGTVEVGIDFNQIPRNLLRQYKDFVSQYAAAHPGALSNSSVNRTLGSYHASNYIGMLLIPSSSTFNPTTISFPSGGFSLSLYSNPTQRWNGTAYESVKIYEITTSLPNNYANASLNIDFLNRYLNQNGVPFLLYKVLLPTVNNEYQLPEKQSYLNYVYRMRGLPVTNVLDTILPQPLGSGIGLFSGKLLRYGQPAQPGRIEHLYVADPATATNGTHYPVLSYMLNQVKNHLSGNIFFAGGSAAINIPVGAGQQLMAYRCRDTAFWYRYFGPGDTLYNAFVRIPAYLDTNYFNAYTVTGLTFNPGEGDSRSFKVTLHSNSSPIPDLELDGYTDFTVARNQVLRNVLLAHAVNEPIPLGDTVNNCERQRLNAAIVEGRERYRIYIDSIRTRLNADFYAWIMGAGIQEKLNVGYRSQRFNYTLYYYDRAGNLMRTVPPAGVHMLAGPTLYAVDGARLSNGLVLPAHNKPSDYKYNTLNQVVTQTTPDGGRTDYFYDAAGRAIFSQNARQRPEGKMTYTLYDKQGRIMETGQAVMVCVPHFDPYPSPTNLTNEPCSHYISGVITPYPAIVQELQLRSHDEVVAYVRSLSREEVVLTQYDTEAQNLMTAATGLSRQENLRKRVSCIKYFDNLEPQDANFLKYQYALHFSYDIAGNVKTLTRDYPFWKVQKQQFKRIDYDYDVISGKVNMLSYNRSFADQYFQRYSYDGDNRITKVETSADGYLWKRDAEYQYYQHGPLARMSLGDMRVQGVDYAYTIQGWLKAVNGDLLQPDKDMGGDAAGNSIHARDVIALTLDYFKGDYRPVGSTAVTHLAAPARSLYNGNIPRATTSITPFPALNTRYTYDQLNRITKAGYAYMNPYDGQLNNTADYASSYAYDPDGNLQRLNRSGNALGGQSQLMDSLEYHYQPGGSTNRLQNITDVVSNNNFHNDIKHYTNTAASRYLYDATGNTIKDQVSGQDTILWNHYNKVTQT
ncbi:RHS repeat domain-containing protein, partial [Taibaiella helva]|uniref:hypothetical protein n=1 Tax=Taibaiella helva TaxID=2301235 RepID=UPI0013008468